MKSEKGLSFLSTAILVVVIALIVCAAVYFIRMQVTKEKSEDIKTDMLLVEAKISKTSGDYTLEKKDEILVGTKLSEMKEEPVIKEFLDKELFDPEEKDAKYYVLNQDNLNELGLEKVTIQEGSYYIVDYASSSVYYTQGYMDENGDTHYKAEKQLSQQQEEKSEEKQDEKNEEQQDEKDNKETK